MELSIRVPPIVGVPCLERWVLGPSSLTTWPTCISFILFINLGPNINENSSEVRVANIALVDKNSTTRNGPKNSERYSNKGNSIYFFNLSAIKSILVDLEPFTNNIVLLSNTETK